MKIIIDDEWHINERRLEYHINVQRFFFLYIYFLFSLLRAKLTNTAKQELYTRQDIEEGATLLLYFLLVAAPVKSVFGAKLSG